MESKVTLSLNDIGLRLHRKALSLFDGVSLKVLSEKGSISEVEIEFADSSVKQDYLRLANRLLLTVIHITIPTEDLRFFQKASEGFDGIKIIVVAREKMVRVQIEIDYSDYFLKTGKHLDDFHELVAELSQEGENS